MRRSVADSHPLLHRLGAILRRPIVWMAIQSLGLVVYLAATGGLSPSRQPDTYSYLRAARAESVTQALSHIRTAGYPLVLKVLGKHLDSRSRSFRRVPPAQLLLFVGGVWVFWIGLSRFSGAPWLALAASSPLLWGQPLTLMPQVLPDYLAMAFVLAGIGALLLLVVRRSWWLWGVMALSVFASYQLRPAGVFVVAFLPVLAVALSLLRDSASWAGAVGFGAMVALLTVGPLLGFATLRWAMVGHFGVVSFGGYNAAGMAMLFLDEEVVRELPRDQRRLGRHLYRNRSRRGWHAVGPDDDLFEAMRDQYSMNIFRVGRTRCRALIRQDLRESGGALNTRQLEHNSFMVVESNRRLGELARSVLRLRPASYRRWLGLSLGHGIERLVQVPLNRWLFVLWIVGLPVALARRGRTGPWERERGRAIVGLAILALGFFAAYLCLVALVSYPFPRYFVSISLFVPSLLAALLFETWRAVVRSFRNVDADPLVSRP